MQPRALVSSLLILTGVLGPFAVLAVGPTDANRAALLLLLTLALATLLAGLALALRAPRSPRAPRG